tara:strand:+ start:932 stop:1222 length:291 start_codon:yes stop_codon:yes gene_type:complete
MRTLFKQLPEGDKGKSIQSPKTIILIRLESLRRKFNRENDENLSMITFLHVYYSNKLNKPINEVCLLGRLTVEIMTFDKQRQYLEKAIYNNNVKVL